MGVKFREFRLHLSGVLGMKKKIFFWGGGGGGGRMGDIVSNFIQDLIVA